MVIVLVTLLLLFILTYGHLAIWIACFNRAHALPVPVRLIRSSELMQILAAAGLLGMIVRAFLAAGAERGEWLAWPAHSPWLGPYSVLCFAAAAWMTGHWVYRQLIVQRPAQLISNDTEFLDIGQQLDRLPVSGLTPRVFACLPGNQMFQLSVNVKTVVLPRLPPQLDGLTITHLSDLHFTGRITRPFFDRVIDETLALGGDLIAITGDIQESEECYEWLRPTLGRLRAPHGVLFVLGNHDYRMKDVRHFRRELAALGLVDLGTTYHQFTLGGVLVQLAGNELPWFGPPCELPQRDASQPGLRVLLSHSPDQILWARQRDFDLMLAGHTHGGHIRLPVIGPIVCPSRFGVKYAAGVFYEHPTLLHVTRGISGLDPIRFHCPPELTRLVLRSGTR